MMLRLTLPPTAPVLPCRKISPRLSSFHGVQLRAVPSAPPACVRRISPAETVKMMAKREEDMKEIRAMSTEQINEEVIDLKGELLMLRLQKSARNEFKPSEFGRMRKRHGICHLRCYMLPHGLPWGVGVLHCPRDVLPPHSLDYW